MWQLAHFDFATGHTFACGGAAAAAGEWQARHFVS